MNPRSIRRAAERKALKRARRADRSATECQPEPAAQALPILGESPDSTLPIPPVTEARLAANRANAQLSTGPTSSEGKAKSSLNAVTNALTGRTVLLPADDRDRYQQHVAAFFKEYNPIGARECDLAQSLADLAQSLTDLAQSLTDIAWRLTRIAALEMALFANGRSQFEDLVTADAPAARPALLDMHTFLHYERQLRNLSTQESRLLRQREKQSAELKQLQQDRVKEEREQLEMAAKLYLTAKKDRKPFHPEEYGFEFSIADVEGYLEGVRAAALTRETLKTAGQPQTRHANAA